MDLFQRLLETLQRTVDYISTFTTYLLGDEAHPGAEGSGSTTETVPCRSHPDCEVETAHDGGVASRGNLKTCQEPPIAEIIPPNKEIQEASGKALNCVQATESILETSNLSGKDERQEDAGQKLSEPSNFLADAPEPRSSTIENIQQRDLEGPTVTKGLHQWASESTARMGAVQREFLEEMADMKEWKPEKLLAGGEELEELGRAGKAEGTWQREQKETERDEQEGPGGAKSDGEEQRGLNGAAGTGRFQDEVAKMVEDLRPEPDGQLAGGSNMEDNPQEEPDVEARDEGVHPAVPDNAESRGDQEGGPEGEVEARNSPEQKQEETVTLEVQEEDPKEVAEKGDVQQRGLEGAEREEPRQGELEGFVRNKGTQWREQEENEGDEHEGPGGAESDGEEQRGLNGAAGTGRLQDEEAKRVEDLRPEPDGQLAGGSNMEDNLQEEPDVEAGDEGVQPAVPESAESGGDQEGGPEVEVEVRSNSRWEPEEQESTDGEKSGTEEQRGDGTAWTGRPQQEVAKMAEDQSLEAEGPLAGGAEADRYLQEEPDVDPGDEGAQRTMLDGAESRGDQQGGQVVEAEEGRKLQWEPEETVTSEEHPEKGNSQQQGLEGAEAREGHQRGKLEGLVENEAGTGEEQREEPMGEAGLERDQQTDSEAMAGITVREEVVAAEVVEEPRETEGTERGLLHKPTGYKASVNTCCSAGTGLFPDEVPSLDTSAQKERVLLRRKSSIRRAPSLKRPRPPIETPPQQETCVEENSPPPPPAPGRPSLRHAGFGPVHPNMMAELQMRLRRPQ